MAFAHTHMQHRSISERKATYTTECHKPIIKNTWFDSSTSSEKKQMGGKQNAILHTFLIAASRVQNLPNIPLLQLPALDSLCTRTFTYLEAHYSWTRYQHRNEEVNSSLLFYAFTIFFSVIHHNLNLAPQSPRHPSFPQTFPIH